MSEKAKKLSKQEIAENAAAELNDAQLWAGWLKKTRRSKKAGKLKETDDRYFVVLKADGEVCLTWTKEEDPVKLLAGDHFHPISGIVCNCKGWKDGGTDFSFELELPDDIRPHKKKAKKMEEGTAKDEVLEVSAKDDDSSALYKLFRALISAGATINGGAPKETDRGRKPLEVIQTSNEVEFTLDDDNCLKDFKGSLLKAKGIAMGLKLGSVNDVDTLGWPKWAIENECRVTTKLPMTCKFFTCDSTQQVIDESVEHCVGKVAVVTGVCGEITSALAAILAAEGADVALIDESSQDAIDSVVTKLIDDQFGGVAQMEFAKRKIIGYGDVRANDDGSIGSAIDRILGDFGKIDILINGVTSSSSLTVSSATSPADFMSDVENAVGTIVGSYTSTTNAVLQKAMVPASSGCVVGISYCMGRESIDLASEEYQVRKPPSWPRSWANFSLSYT